MKKLLLIFLALVMCVSLCACGGKDTDNDSSDATTSTYDGSIELTLENYKQYLDVSVECNLLAENMYEFETEQYKSFVFKLHVKGLSTNFNYQDIVVNARIKASAQSAGQYDAHKIEKDLEVRTNIAGNGEERQTHKVGKNLIRSSFEYKYEIISVSGKIVPA